jgi:hypothetical protein
MGDDLGLPLGRGEGNLISFLWLGCFLPFHSRERQAGQRMGMNAICWMFSHLIFRYDEIHLRIAEDAVFTLREGEKR